MYAKVRKKFHKGWKKFYDTFPNAPKTSSALVLGLKDIFCVTTVSQVKNYVNGRTPLTPMEIKAVEKLFRQFNISDPWDDTDSDSTLL